ncbi:MAG: M16 family metallopeptidase [Deltaproteobacteria bacterium]
MTPALGGAVISLALVAAAPGPWPAQRAPARARGRAPAAAAADTETAAYETAGVRVIQRIDRGSDVVAARVYLLGGTRQLVPVTAGIEPLLLRASGYGTAQYPGPEARRAMARTGSRVVIEAGSDWTVFGFTGLAGKFTASWRVLADRLVAPTLADSAVETARALLLADVRSRYADPDERIRLMATRSRFRGHPYSLDPWGTDFSVPQITRSQLVAYHDSQVVKSRLLVVVSGNVDRPTVEQLVGETLGRLPAGTYRWTMPPPAPALDARWLIESRQLPTNYILGYFTGPPPQSRDYPAFVVATGLLSGAVGGAVRTRRGLSYAAYAPLVEQAIPVGGVYASTASPGDVMRILDDEMRLLQGIRIPQQWIDEMVARSELEIGTEDQEAELLAHAEIYFGDYRRAGPNMARLRRVTSQDLATVSDKYLRYMSLAFIGDTTKMHGHW